MSRNLGVALFGGFILLAVGFVLWLPYNAGAVPEWKLRVVDRGGNPVVGVQAFQEWLDPIDDGITKTDSRSTDSLGEVDFPKRILHNRLALGRFYRGPIARVFVCGQGQFGEALFDVTNPKTLPLLKLKKGDCPFM